MADMPKKDGIYVKWYGPPFTSAKKDNSKAGTSSVTLPPIIGAKYAIKKSLVLKIGDTIEKFYTISSETGSGFTVNNNQHITLASLAKSGYARVSNPLDIVITYQRIPVQIIIMVNGKQTYNKQNRAYLHNGQTFSLEPRTITESMKPYAGSKFFMNYSQDVIGERPVPLRDLTDSIKDNTTKCNIDWNSTNRVATIKITATYKYNWTGAHVTKAFLDKVESVAGQLSVHPDDLMAVMAFESWLNPSAVNSNSGATGLIQFMPDTAIGLGTSTSSLAKMSAVDQMDYVYAYLVPYAGRMSTLGDIYMAVLWPGAIGKPDSYVLWTREDIRYKQNNGLDKNMDGVITKAEAMQMVIERRNVFSLK